MIGLYITSTLFGMAIGFIILAIQARIKRKRIEQETVRLLQNREKILKQLKS